MVWYPKEGFSLGTFRFLGIGVVSILLVREQCIDCCAACFRKRVVLFERVLLTEACRGKGITLFLSFQLVMTCSDFCCNALLCVWHVCVMYSRDEKVFTIRALFYI